MNETKNQRTVASGHEALDVMPVIRRYVALKRRAKRLELLLKAEYENFAAAANAIDANGMKVGNAQIILATTPRKWEWPAKIVKAEKALTAQKENWKETHDHDSGGEPLWKVETNL